MSTARVHALQMLRRDIKPCAYYTCTRKTHNVVLRYIVIVMQLGRGLQNGKVHFGIIVFFSKRFTSAPVFTHELLRLSLTRDSPESAGGHDDDDDDVYIQL